MAVEETQVAELQGRDDEEGEEAEGHVGGVERAAEGLGRLAQASVGGRRILGVAVTHQTGHGERQHILEAAVPDDGNAPLVLDQVTQHKLEFRELTRVLSLIIIILFSSCIYQISE